MFVPVACILAIGAWFSDITSQKQPGNATLFASFAVAGGAWVTYRLTVQKGQRESRQIALEESRQIDDRWLEGIKLVEGGHHESTGLIHLCTIIGEIRGNRVRQSELARRLAILSASRIGVASLNGMPSGDADLSRCRAVVAALSSLDAQGNSDDESFRLDLTGRKLVGHYDLARVRIPRGCSVDLTGSRIAGFVDLSDSCIDGSLILDKCHVTGRVMLTGSTINGSVRFNEAVVFETGTMSLDECLLGRNIKGGMSVQTGIFSNSCQVAGRLDLAGTKRAQGANPRSSCEVRFEHLRLAPVATSGPYPELRREAETSDGQGRRDCLIDLSGNHQGPTDWVFTISEAAFDLGDVINLRHSYWGPDACVRIEDLSPAGPPATWNLAGLHLAAGDVFSLDSAPLDEGVYRAATLQIDGLRLDGEPSGDPPALSIEGYKIMLPSELRVASGSGQIRFARCELAGIGDEFDGRTATFFLSIDRKVAKLSIEFGDSGGGGDPDYGSSILITEPVLLSARCHSSSATKLAVMLDDPAEFFGPMSWKESFPDSTGKLWRMRTIAAQVVRCSIDEPAFEGNLKGQ